MQVRSFVSELLMTLDEVIHSHPFCIILVPTLELYHEVRGTLTLLGSTIEVKCLPPPSVHQALSNAHTLIYYVTISNYEAETFVEVVDDAHLRGNYYFKYISEVSNES